MQDVTILLPTRYVRLVQQMSICVHQYQKLEHCTALYSHLYLNEREGRHGQTTEHSLWVMASMWKATSKVDRITMLIAHVTASVAIILKVKKSGDSY